MAPEAHLERLAASSEAHHEARRQRDAAISEALHGGTHFHDVARAAALSPAELRKIWTELRLTPVDALLDDVTVFLTECAASGSWDDNFDDLACELAKWIPQWAAAIEGKHQHRRGGSTGGDPRPGP